MALAVIVVGLTFSNVGIFLYWVVRSPGPSEPSRWLMQSKEEEQFQSWTVWDQRRLHVEVQRQSWPAPVVATKALTTESYLPMVWRKSTIRLLKIHDVGALTRSLAELSDVEGVFDDVCGCFQSVDLLYRGLQPEGGCAVLRICQDGARGVAQPGYVEFSS